MKFRLMVDFDSNKWSVDNSTKLFDSVTELLHSTMHYTDASVESIDLRLLEDAMSCTKYCRPEFDEHSEECIKDQDELKKFNREYVEIREGEIKREMEQKGVAK